jgi:hypothetical protein
VTILHDQIHQVEGGIVINWSRYLGLSPEAANGFV